LDTTLIVDNFITPETSFILRNVAEHAEYKTEHHDGFAYDGISVIDNIEAMVDYSLIVAPLGMNPIPSLSYFYMAQLGHTTQSWIHSDNTVDQLASVLYLPPVSPCSPSGTMMLRHRATGLSGLPDVPVSEDVAQRLLADHENLDEWIVEDTISEKTGRLLVYPTSRFHARYPRFGFGSSPQTARIVLVSFFGEAGV